MELFRRENEDRTHSFLGYLTKLSTFLELHSCIGDFSYTPLVLVEMANHTSNRLLNSIDNHNTAVIRFLNMHEGIK